MHCRSEVALYGTVPWLGNLEMKLNPCRRWGLRSKECFFGKSSQSGKAFFPVREWDPCREQLRRIRSFLQLEVTKQYKDDKDDKGRKRCVLGIETFMDSPCLLPCVHIIEAIKHH